MKRPTRVVMAVAFPPPIHGQSTVNQAVANELRSLGVHTKLADISPATPSKNLYYHTSRALRVLRALHSMARNANIPDKTLYGVVESGYGIVYNFAIVATARMLSYRIVLHHHTSAHTIGFRKSFNYLTKIGGPNVIHVVLSDKMANDLRKYAEVRRVQVARNACHVSTPKIDSPRTMSARSFRLGFLSNLSVEKGLDTVVEVVISGRRAGHNIELMLAGPIVDDSALSVLQKARSELKEALTEIGPVGEGKKDRFYREIDAFVFPSRYRYEAQPLVVLEAMSYGLPVFVSSQGYIAEMVKPPGAIVVQDQGAFADIVISRLAKWTADRSTYEQASYGARETFEHLQRKASRDLIELMKLLCSGRHDQAGSAQAR